MTEQRVFVPVKVWDEGLSDEGSNDPFVDGELQAVFTDEGLVLDVSVNGEVLKTNSMTYGELIEDWLK